MCRGSSNHLLMSIMGVACYYHPCLFNLSEDLPCSSRHSNMQKIGLVAFVTSLAVNVHFLGRSKDVHDVIKVKSPTATHLALTFALGFILVFRTILRVFCA
jgi:hypothetical protein